MRLKISEEHRSMTQTNLRARLTRNTEQQKKDWLKINDFLADLEKS